MYVSLQGCVWWRCTYQLLHLHAEKSACHGSVLHPQHLHCKLRVEFTACSTACTPAYHAVQPPRGFVVRYIPYQGIKSSQGIARLVCLIQHTVCHICDYAMPEQQQALQISAGCCACTDNYLLAQATAVDQRQVKVQDCHQGCLCTFALRLQSPGLSHCQLQQAVLPLVKGIAASA